MDLQESAIHSAKHIPKDDQVKAEKNPVDSHSEAITKTKTSLEKHAKNLQTLSNDNKLKKPKNSLSMKNCQVSDKDFDDKILYQNEKVTRSFTRNNCPRTQNTRKKVRYLIQCFPFTKKNT